MNRVFRNIFNNTKLLISVIILALLVFVAVYPYLKDKKNKTFTVTLNVENATLEENVMKVKKGREAVFYYELEDGYSVENVETDCTDIDIKKKYISINKVKKDTVCNVNFYKEVETYEVTVNVINGTTEPTKKVEMGGSAEFEIAADEGFITEEPEIDCEGSSYENGILSIQNVTENRTCNITLAPAEKKYKATIRVVNGSTTATTVSVPEGEEAAFTINANKGYTTKDAKVSCSGDIKHSVSGNNFKIPNLTSDIDCTVELVKQTLKITLNISGIANKTTYAYVKYGESVAIYIQDKRSQDILTMDKSSIICNPNSTQFDDPTWDSENKWLYVIFRNVTSNATCSATLGTKS